MLIQREIVDVIVCRLAQDPHVTVFIVVEEEASVLLVFQEVTMPAHSEQPLFVPSFRVVLITQVREVIRSR